MPLFSTHGQKILLPRFGQRYERTYVSAFDSHVGYAFWQKHNEGAVLLDREKIEGETVLYDHAAESIDDVGFKLPVVNDITEIRYTFIGDEYKSIVDDLYGRDTDQHVFLPEGQ
jgi:hypothetical protein